MKKENFSIEGNYALSANGCHIDLHNNFDFMGFSYDALSSSLTLNWVKTEGAWVGSDELSKVEIKFETVTFLKVHRNSINNEDADSSKTLALLGYLHPDDVDTMDGSLDEREANSDYHMIFLFEDSLAIKVFSSCAICRIE